MGGRGKAVAISASVEAPPDLDRQQVDELFARAMKSEFSPHLHSMKQGLSALLSRYKDRTGKTNKEIGLAIGVTESVVSKMLRGAGQFTIDFFIEKLSRLNDDSVNERLAVIASVSRLS
jgi:hypothetical protein